MKLRSHSKEHANTLRDVSTGSPRGVRVNRLQRVTRCKRNCWFKCVLVDTELLTLQSIIWMQQSAHYSQVLIVTKLVVIQTQFILSKQMCSVISLIIPVQ